MKFDVCLIMRNEEKTLPRLLNSLKGVDIYAVDTGSTDKTIEVAKSFGVKVFEQNFDEVITEKMAETLNGFTRKNKEPDIVKVGEKCFNFGKARNWIVEKAKYDMVFMPDCDEVVEWDLKEVEKLVEKADRLEYNFIFNFDNEGRPIIQFLHSKFYNRKKYRWERNIHEIIAPIKYTNKVEGWMSDEELNFLYTVSKNYKSIAEIGSWKGRSTNALLEGCEGIVTAIDHFEGSQQEGDGTHGAKGVYEQFVENTKQFTNLKVLKTDCTEAVKQVKDGEFEMVFIDGGHTYEEVKRDIEMWMPKATRLICGHDYCPAWPGVMKAVEEKFGKVNHVDSIWYKILDGKDIEVNSHKTVFTDKILLKHYQNHETNRTQYLTGLAIDYVQNIYNDRNCHYFARELMYRGMYKTAIDFFNLHISQPGWRTEQGQSYTYIGDCFLYMGNVNEAMKNYAIGWTYDMGRREPLMNIGQILLNQKKYAEAERIFNLANTIPKGNYYSNIEANYTHLPYHQLALCQYYLGRKEESYKNLKKALELDPNNKMYKHNLSFY